MKIGKNTNLTLSLETLIVLLTAAVMSASVYYNSASEDYVDAKIKEALIQQVQPVKVKSDDNKETLHQVDKAIGLLSKTVENQDKNMEAFTEAIKQLSEDIKELYKERNSKKNGP